MTFGYLKKKSDDDFEDVDRFEGKLGSSRKRHNKPRGIEIMLRQRHSRFL